MEHTKETIKIVEKPVYEIVERQIDVPVIQEKVSVVKTEVPIISTDIVEVEVFRDKIIKELEI